MALLSNLFNSKQSPNKNVDYATITSTADSQLFQQPFDTSYLQHAIETTPTYGYIGAATTGNYTVIDYQTLENRLDKIEKMLEKLLEREIAMQKLKQE